MKKSQRDAAGTRRQVLERLKLEAQRDIHEAFVKFRGSITQVQIAEQVWIGLILSTCNLFIIVFG